MKKYLISLLMLLVSFLSFGQLAEKWQQVYGGPGNECGYRVRSCLDQGYIVAGTTASNGPTDGYLVRTDSLGFIMWTKYFVGDNVDVLNSIRQLPDSGYIICGYSNSQGNGGYDGWVLRTDKNGDTLWTKYIGTTDWDFFYDVAPTWDSGFVLAGGSYGGPNGEEDMYFVKIDSLGNIIWTKFYGGAKTEEARGICETGDSLLASAGFTNSLGDTLGDSWILSMTAIGDTVWTTTMGYANSEDKAFGIANCSTYNRLYIAGQTSITGNDDCYIRCMNYNMNTVYTVPFGLAQPDCYNGIEARADGTIAAIGTTFSYGGGNGDMYFFKDRTVWANTTFGTLLSDGGYSVDFTHDGGYIACGFTTGYNSILPNIFLVKIDTNGFSTLVLDIREQPIALSLGSVSVFPNPVQEQTSISFNGVENITGKLFANVYDVAGRKIMTIPNDKWENNSARRASCIINTELFPNGIYQIVIVNSEGFQSNAKFIVAH